MIHINLKFLIRSEQLEALSHICATIHNRIKPHDAFVKNSIYNLIEKVAPSLEDIIQKCRWQQKNVNCVDYFTPIITNKGLCFAFNALNSNDIYTDQ